MENRLCRHCGGSMPSGAWGTMHYCSPACRVDGKRATESARVARYNAKKRAKEKLATAAKPKPVIAAPGCGCGQCTECRLFAACKHDAKIWRAANSKTERGQ